MGDQLANNPEALRLFFTEDIYLVPEVPLRDVQTERPAAPMGAVGEHLGGAAQIRVMSDPVGDSLSIPKISLEDSVADVVHNDGGFAEGEVFKKGELPVVPQSTAAIGEQSAPAVRSDFVFLGKNKRNILILVNDGVNEVSTEQGRELLKNIVKAINLSGADFALLNYSAYDGTSFEVLKQFFSSKVLFAFGVGAAQIGLPYEAQNTLIEHEGIKMIFSSNLNELSADMKGKKALWACLKQMDI